MKNNHNRLLEKVSYVDLNQNGRKLHTSSPYYLFVHEKKNGDGGLFEMLSSLQLKKKARILWITSGRAILVDLGGKKQQSFFYFYLLFFFKKLLFENVKFTVSTWVLYMILFVIQCFLIHLNWTLDPFFFG